MPSRMMIEFNLLAKEIKETRLLLEAGKAKEAAARLDVLALVIHSLADKVIDQETALMLFKDILERTKRRHA